MMRRLLQTPSCLRRAFSRAVVWGVLAVAVAMAAVSCSPKKNTAATRNYQAFITRYNVYFNGDQHYKETLKDMERDYEDDFTGLLLMHPAEAIGREGAPQPSGSFTRSIEKAQKAIQLHSIKKRPRRKPGKGNDPAYKAWLKRDEYNPFLHNAWMMMGRSQYLNGDFLGAASTFYYVSRHFKWLPNTVYEAQLWQARSYCAMDWTFEAEGIVNRIKPDSLKTPTLRGLYYFTASDVAIRQHDYAKAIPLLSEAIRYASKGQKPRLWFLLGQLFAAEGDKGAAYKAYGKARGAAGTSYRAQLNARIKQSEVYEGQDITPEVNSLRRMTRYGSNRDYLDQIYYAIGNLYLSRRDTVQAIRNYELAAEKSTRDGIDKAISQVTLGGLWYDLGRYDKAQPCYSEGVSALPKSYPGYERMKRRSDVLDELAVYAQNVQLNDSLLRLAAMPEAERLAVIERIIKELKEKEKKEADDAAREEYLAEQEAAGNGLQNNDPNAPKQYQLNTDKSWYFYNQATRNAGRTEFQKRWGSRKLEDNWRRRNKNTFSLDGDGGDDPYQQPEEGTYMNGEEDPLEDEETKEARQRENDPHFVEYYLKQIPMTDAEKATAGEVIQEGLYNQGLILKDKMEDFAGAEGEWDRLMARYPDNVYRLDIYYNRYLLDMRLGRPDKAEHWRRQIMSEFPESKYAQAMADPAYLDNLRTMEARQQAMYDAAYEAYLANRNAEVHRAAREIAELYPMSPLIPRFMFLEALAYVTENDNAMFASTIRDLLERYPDTEVSPVASAWLAGINKGRKIHSSGENRRSMLWDIRLGGDSTAVGGEGGLLEFTIAPDDPHYLVLLFSTDRISPNQLLYDVARHNFNTYAVRDFDLELMNFGRLGLLIIKGFANNRELAYYRQLLGQDGQFALPGGVRPVEISRDNFEVLLQGGGSFEDYFSFMGEEGMRGTHESVLPPDEYPSAEEM
ncbi:MAG: hypothetical protein K2L26_04575, partial [Duncaniella sp.]|nr:hypothetical protein [Duncaniella sp.]